MAKIVVTGGTGYIGSHTVVELISKGFEIIIVDNLSNSNEKVLGQIKKITGVEPAFYCLDLCNTDSVRDFADKVGYLDGIIHFAAFKAVGESIEKPVDYYQNNLGSLLNLLLFFPNTNLVFSSSCTVYGEPDILPVTENSPIKKANSPYGNTKQICEEILQDAAISNPNINIIALRYFNPVGAHNSAFIGELPNGIPQNLVPFITQSAIGIRGPIIVHGDDYPTTDGSAIRDYIHVVDVARAHVEALNYLLGDGKKSNYDVFNVGTGMGYSVLQIIQAFEDSTQVKLNYQIGPRRSGDAVQIYGDVSKAQNTLNWKATHSLQDMMLSAWNWQKYIKENPFN